MDLKGSMLRQQRSRKIICGAVPFVGHSPNDMITERGAEKSWGCQMGSGGALRGAGAALRYVNGHVAESCRPGHTSTRDGHTSATCSCLTVGLVDRVLPRSLGLGDAL